MSAATGTNWTDPAWLAGDGVNGWPTIATGAAAQRDGVLLETHPTTAGASRDHGDAIVVGEWKLMKYNVTNGKSKQNGWYVPPGENSLTTPYSIACGTPPTIDNVQCNLAYCLFNLTADPCEHTDVAGSHASVVTLLTARLAEYAKTAVLTTTSGVCSPKTATAPDGTLIWVPCDL
jgi:hypothetical protein